MMNSRTTSSSSTTSFITPLSVVPTHATRVNSLRSSGLMPQGSRGLPAARSTDPWARAVALQQLAHLDESHRDERVAQRFGEAFAWRSGRALERRLEALSVLEEAGAFTHSIYRVIFGAVGAVTREPTVALLHAPGWDFFGGGVQRTLTSGRALGEGRCARVTWQSEDGAGVIDEALDHAQAVVVFVTRDLLANPRFVRELMFAIARVARGTEAAMLAPRLQLVTFDDLPDLRGIPRGQWGESFGDLATELGDPAIRRLGDAIRSVPVVAASGSPPGEVARAVLKSLGR